MNLAHVSSRHARIVLLVLALVCLAAAGVRIWLAAAHNRLTLYNWNFADYTFRYAVYSPYRDGVPMDEMWLDFWPYPAVAYAEEQLILDRPIRYYTREGGAFVPAGTIPAGTSVLFGGKYGENYRGYGFFSWPTYWKGWRYVKPFASADGEMHGLDPDTFYFVPLRDLHAAVHTFFSTDIPGKYFRNTWDTPIGRRKAEYSLLFQCDALQYAGGIWRSADFYYPSFDVVTAVLLVCSGAALAGYAVLRVRARKRA